MADDIEDDNPKEVHVPKGISEDEVDKRIRAVKADLRDEQEKKDHASKAEIEALKSELQTLREWKEELDRREEDKEKASKEETTIVLPPNQEPKTDNTEEKPAPLDHKEPPSSKRRMGWY